MAQEKMDFSKMPTKLWLYPYQQGSEGAQNLAAALCTKDFGVKLIRLENSKFKGKEDRVVINWGNSKVTPEIAKCRVFNHPEAVRRVTNKKTFFQFIQDEVPEDERPRTPPFTIDKPLVAQWLGEGKTAFARTKLTGHSGEGIIDVTDAEMLNDIPDGTLFTMYIPKKQEWRIHVGPDSQVFLRQRKAYSKPEGVAVPAPDWRIRNHKNGFIFERNGGTKPPKDVEQQAIKAVKATGLDFGAVDVIWNQKSDKAYVLEINTAPGLEGSTLEDYTNMIYNQFGG